MFSRSSRDHAGAVALAVVIASVACGRAAAPAASFSFRSQSIVACDRLDSQLMQLVAASDPQRFAANSGLDLDPRGARLLPPIPVPRSH